MAVTISSITPPDGAYRNSKTPTFYCTAEDPNAALITLGLNIYNSSGQEYIKTINGSASGLSANMEPDTPLSDGEWSWFFIASSYTESWEELVDVGYSSVRTITIDTVAPNSPSCSITVLSSTSIRVASSAFSDPSPSSGYGHRTAYLYEWTGSVWTMHSYKTFPSPSSESVDFTGLDPAQQYRVRVVHSDKAGNGASSEYATFVSITNHSPLDNTATKNNKPSFSAIVTDPGEQVTYVGLLAQIWKDGNPQETYIASGGYHPSGTQISMTLSHSLPDGVYRWRLQASSYDEYSMLSTTQTPERILTIDTKAPVKPTCYVEILTETSARITWSTFSDPSPSSGNDGGMVNLQRLKSGSWVGVSTKSFAHFTNYIDFTNLGPDYDYRVRVLHNDKAGNNSDYSDYKELILNTPPTAPTVTYPNGGERITGEQTIVWTMGTDIDDDPLTTEISLSVDNGSTWQVIGTSDVGATSYSYDFSTVQASSLCRIRVRHYDGRNYGSYDMSDGVFTVQHNIAPLAPTNLSPANQIALDKSKVIRLAWKFNDQSGDSQNRFEIKWSADNWATEETITENTPNAYFDVSGNIFPEGTIVWKVRTWDQSDLASPYSTQAQFVTGEPSGAPVILLPGAEVAVSRPTVQWSQVDQAQYQVQVFDNVGTKVWDTGDVVSTNKAITVGIDLVNGTNYTIKVRTKNNIGLWSAYATLTTNVNFIPPAIPELNVSEGIGCLAVQIENPEPSGTEPIVVSNDLLRREPGGEWIRIAQVAENGLYMDYAVISDVEHEYRVMALGGNGATEYSEVRSNQLTLEGALLHSVVDPAGSIYGTLEFEYSKRGQKQVEAAVMRYEGRNRPAVQFGDMVTNELEITLHVVDEDYNSEERKKVEKLLLGGEVLCYRDERGRKVFGVAPGGFTLTDTFYGYAFTFVLLETSYKEEV